MSTAHQNCTCPLCMPKLWQQGIKGSTKPVAEPVGNTADICKHTNTFSYSETKNGVFTSDLRKCIDCNEVMSGRDWAKSQSGNTAGLPPLELIESDWEPGSSLYTVDDYRAATRCRERQLRTLQAELITAKSRIEELESYKFNADHALNLGIQEHQELQAELITVRGERDEWRLDARASFTRNVHLQAENDQLRAERDAAIAEAKCFEDAFNESLQTIVQMKRELDAAKLEERNHAHK